MARTKSTKLKEPVRVRFKQLANGSQSIYLDIYKDGKREYEFLKLYLLPELNSKIKAQNSVTLAAAEKIKSERIIELTENEAGLKHTSSRSKMLVTDWMQTFYEMQCRKGLRAPQCFLILKGMLEKYDKKARMKDVDKDYCLGFIDFMRNDYLGQHDRPLAPRTMSKYFGTLCTALNGAVRADIISENPISKISQIDRIKVPESKREYLTIEEIKQLISTDCQVELVKKAFMFGVYCGLRFSDITALRWGDLSLDNDQWRVAIVMQKTTTPNYLPLSKQAMEWLPDRGDAKDSDRIFTDLISLRNCNYYIEKWVKAAGITKHISFHCSRHTFATLMLTLGADLYTTSKLLGHSDVATTQIYAKIINKKKDDAISLIDKEFGE